LALYDGAQGQVMPAENGFKFDLGDTLQLQYVEDPDRERKYVKLIGCLPGKSLIVTPPTHEGKLLLVREDQLFIVRMFSDNTVQGFQASVLKNYQVPYPHFHLSFPEECESQVVRKAHRVELNMIVSVENKHPDRACQKSPARMTNLSTAGAQIVSKKSLGEAGDTISISMKLVVCGVEKYVNPGAVIRRVKPMESLSGNAVAEISYGVELLPLEEQETILLHSFVYESLIKGVSI